MMDEKMSLKRQGRVKPDNWWASSDLQLFGGLAICVLVGTLFFYEFAHFIHRDLAGAALSGRLALTLGDSYNDYSLYFPPVEKLWFQIAAYLEDLTGLPLDLAVVAITNVAIFFGVGLAYQIRRLTVGASPRFLILSVLTLVILPILFKNIFGLREHLVAVGLWPYLVLRYSDPDGNLISRRLRMLVGLWMGFTLLFRYIYSVVVIVVELTEAIMKRRPILLFRIENLAAGVIVFLYLFTWLGIDPSQREAIGIMVNAIDAFLISPDQNWLKLAANSVTAILLLVASWYSLVSKRSIGIAFATVVATLFAAWIQQRWFEHHVFLITMAYIAWWWIAAKNFKLHINVAVALLILMPIYVQFMNARVFQEQPTEFAEALKNEGLSVAGKRVGILTMNPSPYNEYLASHKALRWNTIMNNAYVSAELKPFDTEDADGTSPPIKLDNPGRRILHDQMLRLWEDMPPDVLILDRTYRAPLRYIEVDWQKVFSNDGRFKAILDNYRPVMVYDGRLVKFTYYVRTR